MQPCFSLTAVERESLLNEWEDWGIKQSFGGKTKRPADAGHTSPHHFKDEGWCVRHQLAGGGNVPSGQLMPDTPALILEVM